jgi:hypothetical protein
MTGNAAQVLELTRQLSPRDQLELIQTLAALARETLEAQTEPEPEAVPDPIMELVGAYAHELPLIGRPEQSECERNSQQEPARPKIERMSR